MRELARVCKNIPRIRVGCLCLVVDSRPLRQFIEAQLLNLDKQLQVAIESFRLFHLRCRCSSSSFKGLAYSILNGPLSDIGGIS